jgi:hypothetical protein
MKYNARILTIALALTLVATPSAETCFVAAAQQAQKLTFKMELCGIGAFSSHQMYTASDGTSLNVDSELYMSLGKAKKALAKELKVARRINDRKDLFDEAGKKTGERIIATVGAAGSERTLWLELEDKFLYKIDAASLRHIEEFRKFDAQPNKSLDRSGGGVFCNLIHPVRVA